MEQTKQTRILVIDDDANFLKMMGLLMQRAGYDFHAATNGVEGLALASSVRPDLVILDMTMPFMQGPEVCRRLREEPATNQTPILILSSLDRVDDKLQGFEAGADDYVTKPINPKELLARINALLVRSQYSRPQLARTIAVVGAKGGVGVSSVALNLAFALNELEYDVTLAELHSGSGALRYHLKMASAPDYGGLLQEAPAALTRSRVERYVVRHDSGVRLLLAPVAAAAHPLTPEHSDTLINILEEGSDYLILDLPPTLDDAVQRALQLTDSVLLVTEPDVLSAHCTRRTLQAFDGWNLSAMVAVVAVNRIPSGMILTRIELENEIGLVQHGRLSTERGNGGLQMDGVPPGIRVIAVIPPSPEGFQDAVRRGLPIVRMEPAARSAQALSELALDIVRLSSPSSSRRQVQI